MQAQNNTYMTTIDIKKRIHHYIDQADERLLKMIYAMLRQDDKAVVAHTTEGKPLTRSEYTKILEESEKQIEQGDYLTHEQLKKEMKKWK